MTVYSDKLVCLYRHPKYNKDFLKDFVDLLTRIFSFDRILIMGEFNIHMCCLEKPMMKDFCDFIDSFNLVQLVSGPTDECRHTLDHVLSYGFSVRKLEVGNAVFSDNMPTSFDLPSLFSKVKHCASVHHCCIINPSTATQCSAPCNSVMREPFDSTCCVGQFSSYFDVA